MEPLYNPQKRLIIPLWREVHDAAKNKELDLGDPSKKTAPFPQAISSLNTLINDWEANKSISFAADLIDSAYTLDLHNKFPDVIEFILKTQKDHQTSLFRFAKRLKEEISESFNDPVTLIEFNNEVFYRQRLRELKRILVSNPANPLDWVEMARNYTILGVFDKAETSIKNALQLAPNNRYVLRSAASFYFHNKKDKGDIDNDINKAYQLIRKSPIIKYDPWLLSIEISLSSKTGRTSSLINYSQKLLESQKFHPYATSELASSLATFYHHKGDYKKARALFKLSLVDPFENSVSQAISLLGKNFILPNENKICSTLVFPYEAKSHKFYFSGNYKEAIIETYKWLGDQPFSLRPIDFGSYISSVFLQDYKTSISLLQYGLKYAPDNPHLLNNLIFDYLMLGDLKTAEGLLNKFRIDPDNLSEIPNKTKVCLLATLGLFSFRSGEPEQGRTLYLKAISKAKELKDDTLTALAVANYAREEILISEVNLENILELLEKHCKNRTEPDVTIIYQRVKELYVKKKKI